ncbi:methyltransferase family protein [Vandammella animalimorsus]|uniref:Protein-S-isoprenylcysteine methyltransferase n=1 Tax=Vandammella animalimorsus TaxID=2029117 RepID=A0A2A2AH02_9BURK|nr:isoprenylcysteine carboxylmethyltransferase family protein [Vandammella animalimorsus]PAT37835.1 protein-S-isoprenylcysteine methyltransferase [Vandammella animalimorsus]
MRALELKIPPPLLAGLFAAAMYGMAAALPQWAWPLPMKAWLAGLSMAAGLSVAALGVLAFRRHRTTVNPLQPQAAARIVTTGVFAHSRNPMYLGMALCLIGWALWLAHPLALLAVPLFIACLQRLQIQPEERILLHKFGQPYADYLERVRRWC